jgi:L-alanine-DL-glutamate epimerase-like enolase superfamily enzyme
MHITSVSRVETDAGITGYGDATLNERERAVHDW